MPASIAEVYVDIVPSFAGVQGAVDTAFNGLGRRLGNDIARDMTRANFGGAGDEAGEQFTRDFNGRLRDSRGRFVAAGEEAGESFSQGAQSRSQRGGEQSGDSFLSGLGGKAMAGVAGIAAAAGAAFMAAWSEATDVKSARAMTMAQLGVDGATAAELGKQAGELYATGYGESIAEMQGLVTSVSSAMPYLFGDSLTKISGQISSFSTAFGMDAADVAADLNTMINSGLAVDVPAALDLLTSGMQSVPDALRGDLSDSVDEYGKHFVQLGFTGSEAMQALTDASALGMYGIDKTGDAIKEFGVLATDGSKSTSDAFADLGLNSDEMSNAILAGGESAQGATQTIVDALLGMQDPTLQAMTALSLFGTPLEDLGVDKIPQFLGVLDGMDGGMQGVEGSAAAMDAALGSTTSSFELMWREGKTKVVDFMIDKVMPAVADAAMWLSEKLAPAFEKVGIWINEKLIPFLKLAWEWFQINLLPTISRVFEMVASGFGAFMAIMQNVIEVIAGIFTGDWNRVWEGIKGIFSAIWEQVVAIAGAAWEMLQAAGAKLLEWFGMLGPWVWERILAFKDQLLVWGGEFLGWLWAGIQAKAPEVWAWFTSLPGWAWSYVAAFAGQLGVWGGEFIGWIWGGITAGAMNVWNWFASLPGTAWGYVSALAATIGQYGVDFVTWIKDGIVSGAESIWTWVKELPGKIWDLLVGLKDKVLELGSTFVGWIVEGVKSVASSIWDAITGALQGDGTTDAPAVPGQSGTPTVLGKRDGGMVGGAGGLRVMADGGDVWQYMPRGTVRGPGGPRDDLVPTMLSNGEFIVNAKDAARTRPLLEQINAGRMADGGLVGAEAAARKTGSDLAWKYANEVITGIKTNPPGGAGFTGNGAWGPVSMNGFAANTAAAKAFIEKQFGGVSSIGGLYGGSVNGSDHPFGKALDVMIRDYKSAAGIASGNAIAEWFINNPGSFGTKYAIWRDRINNAKGGGWQPYSHPGGNNDTLAHRDHVHLSFLTGDGSFSGQPVGDQPAAVGSGAGWMSNIIGKASSKLGLGVGSGVGTGGIGATPPGAAVERWRSLGLDVLSQVGAYKGMQLTQHIDRMLNQIRTESSGNPLARNDTDINAQRGDPSIGLLQVIGSTFRSALNGTPFAGLLRNGQTDPRASMTASTLYSLNRYKSLDRAWQGKAYDNGGWLEPNGGQGINLLNKPEPVLTPSQWDTAAAALRLAVQPSTEREAAPMVNVERIEVTSGTAADVVDEMFWRARLVSR